MKRKKERKKKNKKCEKKKGKNVKNERKKEMEWGVKYKRKTSIHSTFKHVMYQRWLCSCFMLFQEKVQTLIA